MRKTSKKRATAPRTGSSARDEGRERLLTELDEKIRQLALVNGVLRKAVTTSTVGEVLAIFASNLKESIPFDRLSVALCDPARRVFHVPFIYFGGKVQENREPPRPYADTPLTRVVETAQPLLRKNISSEMTFARDREFVEKGLRCEMIFPLAAGATIFGTFQMACFEPGRHTERHLATLGDLMPAIAVVTHRFVQKER
jgi:hypothetical protein